MNMTSHDLARAMMDDRLRDARDRQRRRESRPTRPAAKQPEPAVRRQPGLLSTLLAHLTSASVPWFGAHVHTA
jgi:hypothetical protein